MNKYNITNHNQNNQMITNNDSLNQFNNQNIYLENRKQLKVSGVIKLIQLNPFSFDLDTTLGPLKIKGENLEMQSFDVDNGNILITGDFNSFEYFVKEVKKNKSFIQKLFK